jgi:hypothetical protein
MTWWTCSTGERWTGLEPRALPTDLATPLVILSAANGSQAFTVGKRAARRVERAPRNGTNRRRHVYPRRFPPSAPAPRPLRFPGARRKDPTLLDDLMNWVVPDRDKCRQAAEELAAQHPGASPEQLARKAVATAKSWGVAAGSATGAAANPLIMFPAAVADIAAMLRIEGQMAGTIAALLDPPALLDEQTLRADVVAIVFPGAVSQALRQFGLRAGQRVTRTLIKKYVTESVLKDATRFAAKFMFIRVTKKAVLSKTVPLVGAGIGAAWNWVELEAVGKRAIQYYQRRAIGPSALPQRPQRVSVRQLVRRLPWRSRRGAIIDAAHPLAPLPPPPPPPLPPSNTPDTPLLPAPPDTPS